MGAHQGNLQVGWREDGGAGRSERPVFLDSAMGRSALYYLQGQRRTYLTPPFQVPAEPIAFADFIPDRREREKFRRVATPRSSSEPLGLGWRDVEREQEKVVGAAGGTLVLFDSGKYCTQSK